MRTHTKTGHDCATLKPWDERNGWTRPAALHVKVTRGMECDIDVEEGVDGKACDRNTVGCWVDHVQEESTWYAAVKGAEGEPDWLTHGYSMSHALEMAQDLVKMLYEECKAGGEHCYCRDVTWADMFSSRSPDDVGRGKKCCLCEEECRISEFEPDGL